MGKAGAAGLGFWQVTAAASVHGGDSEAVSGPARSGAIPTRGGGGGGSSRVPAPGFGAGGGRVSGHFSCFCLGGGTSGPVAVRWG